MKLRIKSHSVRIRITTEEAELLQATGHLSQETRIPQSSGEVVSFRYEVAHLPDVADSELKMLPFGIRLVLNTIDFAYLADSSKEGVYVRRPWISENGQPINFVAYIEKDKPKNLKKHKKHKHDMNRGEISHDSDSQEVRES